MTERRTRKEEPEAPPDLEGLLADARREKFEAQLRKWTAVAEQIQDRAARAGADAKARLEEQARDLEDRLGQAQAHIDQLKRAGNSASIAQIEQVDAAWAELRRAFEKAAADLQ